jgi:hypothetical protein
MYTLRPNALIIMNPDRLKKIDVIIPRSQTSSFITESAFIFSDNLS